MRKRMIWFPDIRRDVGNFKTLSWGSKSILAANQGYREDVFEDTARGSAPQIVRRRVPAAFANPLPLSRDGHAVDVAVSPRANPHLGPCRRDRQGLETFQHIGLRELRLVGPSVNPFPAFSRRMPGRASETYLRPADSAVSVVRKCMGSASAPSPQGADNPRANPPAQFVRQEHAIECNRQLPNCSDRWVSDVHRPSAQSDVEHVSAEQIYRSD